ncbi:TetR/AcrR family transcriptional regulator [Rhabdothermincola salaria]|uniref:TetR/AcrR family transcriptional regulator n=1 Tax=Rhabdothermincola salaria TaxID=2903142 RepID=UPI001E49CCAF|nr:TetR/AcrR family transcriptional regulator [Rhabdothermincola salaria]MCD9623263.1 TetR/AcrR family transcriptional regulator [Rhabdothermincola salaria]
MSATIELVGRHGVRGTTIAAIADRAGVGKATIYRRWPTKTELVLAALSTLTLRPPVPDTGTVRGDLHAYQRFSLRLMTGPRGDVLPSLLSAAFEQPELREAWGRYLVSRRAVLREILVRGVERGELRDDLDLDIALDLFSGPLVYRDLIAGLPVDEDVAEDLVDHVLDGLHRSR